jgi:hypothetical protein
MVAIYLTIPFFILALAIAVVPLWWNRMLRVSVDGEMSAQAPART